MPGSMIKTENLEGELKAIADSLLAVSDMGNETQVTEPLEKLEEASLEVGRAWCGSWIGYHSRVYFKGLLPPRPGAPFSSEWGFMDVSSNPTHEDWAEYSVDDIEKAVNSLAGNPDLTKARSHSQSAYKAFEELKPEVLSLLAVALSQVNDSHLSSLKEKASNRIVLQYSDIVAGFRPRGQLRTRDMLALDAGFQVPPHIGVQSDVMWIRQPFVACKDLSDICQQVVAHLRRLRGSSLTVSTKLSRVFIGHGHSLIWRELKDFIADRLKLDWDEFNRVSPAGVPNISRLSQMLDEASIAFLIMTAEDQVQDGSVRARENVIHEAGLFQGRLGFSKAIILLEEGCNEFGNIHGLGQIRFPKGNISAKFEEIRQVLEREGLL